MKYEKYLENEKKKTKTKKTKTKLTALSGQYHNHIKKIVERGKIDECNLTQ